MQFLDDPPRFLFFTGKGGVGKTSVACATALRLARSGRSVLLVSTDPASNVSEALGVEVGDRVVAVPDVPGLSALEIDPEQAADAYRERIIGPVRDLLPAAEIAAITEQLSGSCTTEVASFNEFTELLTDDGRYADFDHIVFDTAPTGHTVRLLALPGSWTDFLAKGKGDASCLGPLAGLDKRRSQYAQAVAALGDPSRTRLVLVTRPQATAITEVTRTRRELAAIGIAATHLVINAVLPDSPDADALEQAVRRREQQAMHDLPADLRDLPQDRIALRADNMVGLAALGTLFDEGGRDAVVVPAAALPPRPLAGVIDELAKSSHGLILCMGKGGVGKTTVAGAIAVGLAERGHAVHLTTTDPAAHVDDALPQSVGGLRVTRIDPAAATRDYREKVMATKGHGLDAQGRAHLAEDLLSPCTEEIAVFGRFAEVIEDSAREFVVVDTAPTGHTLLLLDTAGAYHRDLVRQSGESADSPLSRLRDPDRTKVVLVTLAEPTPVSEALALSADLRRAGIHPWAWVINASLAAAAPGSSLLRRRAAAEAEQYVRVEQACDRVAAVPLLAYEPRGRERLLELAGEVGSLSL